MRFKDKVVIVTGSASGIGLATAKKFASEGAKLVLADINLDKLEKAKAEVLAAGGTDVITGKCDVSSEQQVIDIVQQAKNKFGKIDVIVNNAGLMIFKPIEQQTEDDFLKILKVDLMGAFFFIKQGFLNMQPGSAIVNISSIHAIETTPMVSSYAAAKAALLSLTRSASMEGKPKGIRVNAILPGAIDTPMLWENPNLKAGIEKLDKADVGSPEELANAVAFLASSDASFVQGAMLLVDGGRLDRL